MLRIAFLSCSVSCRLHVANHVALCFGLCRNCIGWCDTKVKSAGEKRAYHKLLTSALDILKAFHIKEEDMFIQQQKSQGLPPPPEIKEYKKSGAVVSWA